MLKTHTIRDNHSNDTAPPSTMDCLQDENEVFKGYQREVNMGIRWISSSFIFYMILVLISLLKHKQNYGPVIQSLDP